MTETTLSIDSINTTALPSGSEASVNSTNVETPEDDYDNLSDENEKSDSENIQDNSDKQTEDELEEEFSKTGSPKAKINMFEDPVTEHRIHGGHLALIFASALVSSIVIDTILASFNELLILDRFFGSCLRGIGSMAQQARI